MRRRWSEPGTGRWFRAILYLSVAALFLYFVVRLGTALARRFRAVQRAYQVRALTHTPAPLATLRARRWDGVVGAGERERIMRGRCE